MANPCNPLLAPAVILGLALGTALPAIAQETAAPDAATTESGTNATGEGTGSAATGTETAGDAGAQGETAVPGTDLNLGVEVGGAMPTAENAKPGQTYLVKSFDDWQQRCVRTELGADPCHLYQLLKDENGNPVAELSVFNMPEGSKGKAVAGATLMAPLETLLTAGLQLAVDSNKPLAYPFTVCTPVGCVARLGFTASELAMLKKGNAARITIVPYVAPDQPVVLNASLKGFTAGYDAMAAANAEADKAAAAAAAKAEGAAAEKAKTGEEAPAP